MVKQGKKDPIEIRLNGLIGLFSELLISQYKITNTSIFQTLTRSGLTPTEIGNIFGKNRSDIGSMLNKAKKQKSKSKKEEKND